MPIEVERLAKPFYWTQAAAVSAWWAALWMAPATRSWFLPQGIDDRALLAFALPDWLLLVAGSIAAAMLPPRDSRRVATAWIVAGASYYATGWCLLLSLLSNEAWINVLAMAPSAAGNTAFAWLAQGLPVFRAARDDQRASLRKTFVQIVVFWSAFLWALPALIRRVEDQAGVDRFEFRAQTEAGVIVFAAASILGLWSAWTLSRLGQGTPLPIDAPRKLVIEGPYAYVRNPMAVAGLGQGMAVAVATGSAGTAVYAVFGSVLWNALARPLEEQDMEVRFGDEFKRYRSAVRCWLPRFSARRVSE